MNISQKEIQSLSVALATYEKHNGTVVIEHQDSVNCTDCYSNGGCKGTCRGDCKSTCGWKNSKY